MSWKRALWIALLGVAPGLVFPQNPRVNQKLSVNPGSPVRQAIFSKIRPFPINPQSVFLGMPTKVLMYEEKIYILDRKLSRIFVFGPDGAFLHSIGQPGQGPGDLEYPLDFTIAASKIYVVSSMVRRIEIFDLGGAFIGRIQLEVPGQYPFSNPNRILVGDNMVIYVTYGLSDALIDSYAESGKHERTLLKRDTALVAPGVNVGNSSHIQFVDGGKAILHFDYFSGLFTKVSLNGDVILAFSAYDKRHAIAHDRVVSDMSAQNTKPVRPGVRVEDYELWSASPCCEKNGNILALLLLRDKDTRQLIYLFSPDGLLKDVTPIDFTNDNSIISMFASGERYFFISQENEIFYAERGAQ